MELQNFIKETLLQITKGVKEAQEEAKVYGAVINPQIISGHINAQIKGKYRPVQNVDFVVGLTTSSENGTDKGIGVMLGNFKAGYEDRKGDSSESVTSVKFSVPLALPVEASSNDKVVAPIDVISKEELPGIYTY